MVSGKEAFRMKACKGNSLVRAHCKVSLGGNCDGCPYYKEQESLKKSDALPKGWICPSYRAWELSEEAMADPYLTID